MGVIYYAKNKINGKYYIGKTMKTLKDRKRRHISSVNNGSDLCFHRAIRKYGEENFEWNVLFESSNKNDLNKLEKFYINKYDTYNNGYNLTYGGDGSSGRVLSNETKMKIGKANTDPSEITRRRMSDNHADFSDSNNPMYGKHHTEEVRIKMRKNHADFSGSNNSMYGKYGKDNPNYGKKRTEESKIKISKSLRGRGLFGFTGGYYSKKDLNPYRRVWQSMICYNKREKSIGCFEDPLSCEILYKLVWDEIHKY